MLQSLPESEAVAASAHPSVSAASHSAPVATVPCERGRGLNASEQETVSDTEREGLRS